MNSNEAQESFMRPRTSVIMKGGAKAKTLNKAAKTDIPKVSISSGENSAFKRVSKRKTPVFNVVPAANVYLDTTGRADTNPIRHNNPRGKQNKSKSWSDNFRLADQPSTSQKPRQTKGSKTAEQPHIYNVDEKMSEARKRTGDLMQSVYASQRIPVTKKGFELSADVLQWRMLCIATSITSRDDVRK